MTAPEPRIKRTVIGDATQTLRLLPVSAHPTQTHQML
jgi:hypothetical protein